MIIILIIFTWNISFKLWMSVVHFLLIIIKVLIIILSNRRVQEVDVTEILARDAKAIKVRIVSHDSWDIRFFHWMIQFWINILHTYFVILFQFTHSAKSLKLFDKNNSKASSSVSKEKNIPNVNGKCQMCIAHSKCPSVIWWKTSTALANICRNHK